MGGQEVVAGTRILPSSVYDLHLAGYSVAQIREYFPSLEAADITASIEHEASRTVVQKRPA
jgi:uncharacterized protein (DUF433 family)